jgi:hypothetical protein
MARRSGILLTILAVTLIGLSRLPRSAFGWDAWAYLLAVLTLLLAVRHLRPLRAVPAAAGLALLAATFVLAGLWRYQPSTTLAGWVLLLFGALVVLSGALARRGDGVRAGALLVAATAALFLVLAAERRELVVYLVAAVGLLGLGPLRVDLTRANVFYTVAITAILVRLALFFELGDHFSLDSIRTAPGFVLVDDGLPLFTVVSCLLLKYALPWLLIFGALLPSLVVAGGVVTSHLLDVLALGYVSRFALVAAVIDPMRALPNGMHGVIALFCLSWAELASFAIAAAFVALFGWPAPARQARAAAAVREVA